MNVNTPQEKHSEKVGESFQNREFSREAPNEFGIDYALIHTDETEKVIQPRETGNLTVTVSSPYLPL